MTDFIMQLGLAALFGFIFVFFWCRSIRRSDAEFCKRQEARYRRHERNSSAFWK